MNARQLRRQVAWLCVSGVLGCGPGTNSGGDAAHDGAPTPDARDVIAPRDATDPADVPVASPMDAAPASDVPKIGVAAQSGAVAAIMRMALLAKGLGVSLYISTGNEADLTVDEFLGALIEDDETKVAVLFVEQIRHPQKFLALAKIARPGI